MKQRGDVSWTAIVLLGLQVVAVAAAEEAPVTLSASVDRSEVTLGERIRYVITVKQPEDLEVTLPSFGASLGEFAIEDFGSDPPRRRSGRLTRRQWYLLDAYVAGDYTIPEPVATYRGSDGTEYEVRGQAITVMVKSLLPSEWESLDIRAAKPPLARRRGGWWWLLGVVALLGTGLGIWWWRRRRRGSVAGPPPKPPHQIALEELEVLRREDLPASQRYEEYYIRLSGIVRRYVEGRFGLRAPEMTTEEFLQAAAESTALSFDQRQLLRQFLMHCDLVKFARYRPSAQEAEETYAAAQRLVQETQPAAEPERVPAATSREHDDR